MDGVIVYWSRYGNGKKVVDYLEKRMREKGVNTQVMRTDEADPAKMPDADFYVFSSPTEAFRVQKNMRKFMKNLQGVENKKYGVINTHKMKRNWLKSMNKVLSKKEMVKVADLDFRVGDKTESGDGLPQGWKMKMDEFVEKLSTAS
ncbi:MAG: flavodoxin family protein [Thermoplasmata archaeon]